MSQPETALVKVGCRYYGKNGMFGPLIDTGGNQCGLIIESHSPCQMERWGREPDEAQCPLVDALRKAKGRSQ